jgi:hypothetical protein
MVVSLYEAALEQSGAVFICAQRVQGCGLIEWVQRVHGPEIKRAYKRF